MEGNKLRVSRLDYCQYLLSSQINYTLTNFADHTEKFSHDAINRYLGGEKITPHLVWENVKGQVVQIPEGYLVFDDTVVDKNFSFKMDLVRRQYSGDAHGIIKGVGVVTCVYVNPDLDQFWILDYRIYDPDGDGKTKLDHVQDMLTHCVFQKQLLFRFVLMDSWYATKDIMLFVEGLQKIYYCPLKDNRQVDDSGREQPYQRVDGLQWSQAEQEQGKVVKIKGFPKEHKVKLFRVVLSTQRTDYIVTNDFAQDDTQAVQKVCSLRWKIEQFHRETKQLTGLEGCQCRKARILRNHIGCAILVWVRLKQVAHETERTIYQVKHGLLSDYLRQQLKSPAIRMTLA
ncbi:MAG TPA: transposase [Candidatus Krumholzibacteriaceae bacterium]|nr:transposase [Candidatus Krumholzibacteriaceae bacterium]